MNNAYDLRYSEYRYVRGRSKLIDECENLFPNSLIVPSGMAALSLVLQFYKPKSIWYPKDIFRENKSLIEFFDIPYNDNEPDMVLVEYPSFCGNKPDNPFPNALFVVDNSVDAEENPDCDILITSLSKHYMNCESVLGLITLKSHTNDLPNLRTLRCRSGYVVFDFQCKLLLKHYYNFHTLMSKTREKAIQLNKLLNSQNVDNIQTGSMVFVLVDESPRDVALKTPFELRPTYGCDRTFCSYSYYDGDLAYFQKSYIRISVGLDYSAQEICNYILKAIET